jgi:site-specific DNA-methyltransferase (adenine-specific)
VTPYYEDGSVTIYCGDARAVLPQLAQRFDCAVVDPPYSETSLEWDRRVPGWPALVGGALVDNASLWCFGSLRMFVETWQEFDDWRHSQEVIWEKHNGSGFAADRFKRVHEIAVHFYRRDTPWGDVFKHPVKTPDANARRVRRRRQPPHMGVVGEHFYESLEGGGRLARSVLYFRSCHGSAVHPTQKPVELVRMLLEYSLRPGGVVLDPFMGSGTTLVAARELGRRAVGIEVDEGYCRSAVERLSQRVLPGVV